MIRHIAGLPILTSAQMRAVEAEGARCGVSADDLMELAGLEVARVVRRIVGGRRINVAAGTGDNGGVAYVAARHLQDWGEDVYVMPVGAPGSDAATRAASLWSGPTGQEYRHGTDNFRSVLLDGTYDAQRPIPVDEGNRLMWLSASRGTTVSIDFPSGRDPDSGAERHSETGSYAIARWADITVALGALKPVHVLAALECGHVLFVDYGIAFSDWDDGYIRRIQDADRRWYFATTGRNVNKPAATAHKYRSMVSIVSGSMPGAARLAARAALGAGAGYVVLYGDPTGAGPLDAVVHRPLDEVEALFAAEEGAIVLGPGLGRDERARALLDAALATPAKLVLDGDALSLLGEGAVNRVRGRSEKRYRTVLTPHEGEFNRMFGDTGGSKLDRTLAASVACGCAVVHKGACTVFAYDGDCTASVDGPSWLATAGTGDVLAGAIAAQLATNGGGYVGVEAGVYLHAQAAVIAASSFSADQLADCLPQAMTRAEWPRV